MCKRLCLYSYINVCVYADIHTHAHTQTHTHTLYEYIFIHAHKHIRMLVHAEFAQERVCVSIYIYMFHLYIYIWYTCIFIYEHAYIPQYIHIYAYTYTGSTWGIRAQESAGRARALAFGLLLFTTVGPIHAADVYYCRTYTRSCTSCFSPLYNLYTQLMFTTVGTRSCWLLL